MAKPIVTEEWIANQRQATPVLFCDLDGTIRKGKDELGRFVNCATDVEVFEGVPEILREYKRRGWRIVAVTNQGGVSLGIVSIQDVSEALIETAKQCNGLFDKIMMCTHHPDAEDPEYAVCWCRKPRIGLLIHATQNMAGRFNEYYPPHMALMIGDRPEDKQCAENAGIRFMDAREWREGGWNLSEWPRSYITADSTGTLEQ